MSTKDERIRVVDLYAIRFDPVFRMQDFASYVHENIPIEILEELNMFISMVYL